MPWYAAHIVLVTRFKDGVQNVWHVWENVVMIEAKNSDEAYEIADRKGQGEADASADENYHYDERPAVWEYAGVRKLKECIETFDPEQRATGGAEEHGTEVTYSSFLLADETALNDFVADKTVTVTYEGWG